MRHALLAWTVVTDPVATESVYGQIRAGASALCGCAPCANFDAARPTHYPSVFRELLHAIAIDARKETRVRLVTPLEHGFQLYAGTYLFCGDILAGRAFRGFPFLREEVDVFECVASTVHVALRPCLDPEGPWIPWHSVRLEFLVVLPWVLESPWISPVELGEPSRCLSS